MTKPSAYQATVLMLFLLASALAVATPAEAHSVSQYYPMRWSNPTVNWKFNPNFSGSAAKRTRIQESFVTWTDVTNSALTFVQQADATSGYTASNPCSSSATYNGIFYNTSVAFGTTYLCFTNSQVSRFAMVLEQREDTFWDDGDGDTGTHFFKSVVTHEVGHAGGFGTKYSLTGNPEDLHFLASSTSDGICFRDDTYHTMCNGLTNPVPVMIRTLEEHDIDTVQAAY